jgi:putative transposase
MWLIGGREDIPIVLGKYAENKVSLPKRGQVDLVFKNKAFYLNVLVDFPDSQPIDPEGVLGVDLGIVNIATDSSGETHSSQQIERQRIRLYNLKGELQKKGTRSAKRHLKRLSGKENRFRTDINHCISKSIISKCLRHSLAVGLEDLKGIRKRTVRKTQRDKHNAWAFYQLRLFIEYKAKLQGIPVVAVDPRYTSQSCNECGFKDKRNRKSQAEFCCLDCGYSTNADYNAAIIARCIEN